MNAWKSINIALVDNTGKQVPKDGRSRQILLWVFMYAGL